MKRPDHSLELLSPNAILPVFSIGLDAHAIHPRRTPFRLCALEQAARATLMGFGCSAAGLTVSAVGS